MIVTGFSDWVLTVFFIICCLVVRSEGECCSLSSIEMLSFAIFCQRNLLLILSNALKIWIEVYLRFV